MRRALLAIGAPAVAGGLVLAAARVWAWPAWLGVVVVAGASGVFALRRRRSAPTSGANPQPAGIRVYAMQRPLRTVLPYGIPADAPYTVGVTTRTQMALIIAPGSAVGSKGRWVPCSGHNVTLTLTAPETGPLKVTAIRAGVLAHTPFPGPVDIILATRRMPDLIFSPDLLESLQRSAAAYEPLPVPDAAILLDEDPPGVAMLRPLDSPPFDIAAGGTRSLFFAPVTAMRGWARWRLICEISCEGRTDRISWDLDVTAETGMATYQSGAGPTWNPVHEHFADHWDPDNDKRDREPGWEGNDSFQVAAHTAADGNGFLMGPSRPGPDPEPPDAATLRELGDAYRAAGRASEAAVVYRRAADAGSGLAAYSLGILRQREGNDREARHWLRQAADRRIFTAFNDLGVVEFGRQALDEAETWFRRAMDEGDWTAAVNLAGVHVAHDRYGEAEEILRPAQRANVPLATRNLVALLVRQDRLDEAEQLLSEDLARDFTFGPFPAGPKHVRQFRLAEFRLNVRRDIPRGLQMMQTAIDDAATPPDAVALAAAALDQLTSALCSGDDPNVAGALHAATVRVSAYRRLCAIPAQDQRRSYSRALEDLITIASVAGDERAVAAVQIELQNLRAAASDGG